MYHNLYLSHDRDLLRGRTAQSLSSMGQGTVLHTPSLVFTCACTEMSILSHNHFRNRAADGDSHYMSTSHTATKEAWAEEAALVTFRDLSLYSMA